MPHLSVPVVMVFALFRKNSMVWNLSCSPNGAGYLIIEHYASGRSASELESGLCYRGRKPSSSAGSGGCPFLWRIVP